VLNERFGVDAAVIVTVLLFVVAPVLAFGMICWLVVQMRQVKSAIAWMAWRMGAPAPRQNGVVTPFRRRSGGEG
jgi:hypothetical protein